MNAHSAARAAGLVLLAGLAVGNVGCTHARARRVIDACLPPADCDTPCPPDAKAGPRAHGKHHAPKAPTVTCESDCPPKAVVKHHAPAVKCDADCAPNIVEVRQAPPVHVKVPPQDVIVNVPQQSAPVPPMAAPTPPVQPMAGGYVTPAASPGMVPVNVTHVPANRARLGFAFDTVRIRVPIIRPIAIPTVPEATVQVAVQPVAVQQAAFVQPQPVAVQPVAVHQQFVQPVAPQMQVMPVAPPQMQVMPVAPPPMQVMPVAPNQQSIDDYCRQVDALMRALEASKRAAGCPPLNPPAR